MVVRAARSEVFGQQKWRRPSAGPGARSRSADPRLRLEPLPGGSASPTDAGGSKAPLPPRDLKAEGACIAAPSNGSPTRRVPQRPHLHGRPASGNVSRSLGPQPSHATPAAASLAPSSPTPRRLLRPRNCSRTPSSPSPCWEETLEPEESAGEDVCGDPAPQEAEDAAYSEGYSEEGGESEDVSWASEDDASGSNASEESKRSWRSCGEAAALDADALRELQEIEMALAKKEKELLEVQAHGAELSNHLASVESAAGEARKVVVRLEAGIDRKQAEMEAAAEASAPHQTPRQAPKTKEEQMRERKRLAPSKPACQDLDDLVGAWSQARAAMGIAFASGSNASTSHR